MKKVLLFVAVLSVVSLGSCKKKTCSTTSNGYTVTCCTDCSKLEKDACKAGGYTCE